MLPPAVRGALALIGNTPLVRVGCFDTAGSELWLKLESHNPGGSIEDLIEATAGNTGLGLGLGLGLALVAALRGYRLSLVIPDRMSQEKVTHLRALGANVIWTRSDVGERIA